MAIYMTPANRVKYDADAAAYSTASQIQASSTDELRIRADRPFIMTVSGLSGNTTTVINVDLYRAQSTNRSGGFSGIRQSSGMTIGRSTADQVYVTLAGSTLPASTYVTQVFGPFGYRNAGSFASTDTAYNYVKLIVTADSGTLHALYSTEPVLHFQYVA